jgi:Methylamine utilisation protein MauE
MDPAGISVGAMSFAVAATFVVAGLGKLSASTEFADSLVRFKITCTSQPWAARGVAVFELAVAVALWVPVLRAGAAAVAAVAFGLFAWLIGRSLRAGDTFPCNCFGSNEREIGTFALIRASALAGLSVALLAILVAGTGGPTGFSDAAVGAAIAAAAGFVGALLMQAWRLLRFDQSWASGWRALGRMAAEQQEGRS